MQPSICSTVLRTPLQPTDKPSSSSPKLKSPKRTDPTLPPNRNNPNPIPPIINLKFHLRPRIPRRHIIDQRIQRRQQHAPSNLMIVRMLHIQHEPVIPHRMARPPCAPIDHQHAGAEDLHLDAGPVDDGHDLWFGERGAGSDGDVSAAAVYGVVPGDAEVVVGAGGEGLCSGVFLCGDEGMSIGRAGIAGWLSVVWFGRP